MWLKGHKVRNDQMFVAPRIGAWIETNRRILSPVTRLVAPHAGAWIETLLHYTHLPVWVAPHTSA
jgi:hypothetical protein